MKPKVSVVINTYNAEKHLQTVLETVKDFDEIVVCDMHSTDRTISIAEQYGCKIIYHEKFPYVEPARNAAIAAANNDWVLVIDADETVPPALKEELYTIAEKNEVGGVYIPFKNYFIDRFMHSAYPDFKLRFFKKEGSYWPPDIHSTPGVEGRVIKLPRNRKDLASEHLANDSVSAVLAKNNNYSTQDMKKKLPRNRKVTWLRLLFSPFFRFFKCYILKKGFLDGKRGFIFAVLKAQYKFSCLAKLYEYQQSQK